MSYVYNPFTKNLDFVGSTGGGGGITTINGDTDSITGSVVTIFTNAATVNSGSSFSFDNTGTVSTLNVTDINTNTLIGSGCGNATAVSNNASNNSGFGNACLSAITTAVSNTAMGQFSMGSLLSGTDNSAIGSGALFSCTTGNANTALGTGAIGSVITGDGNIAIGFNAGVNYVGAETGNLCIQNPGVVSENNVTRIGTEGASAQCFIAGITGTTPTDANTPQVVLCDNAGNLTVTSSSTSGFILTSNGTNAPTFQAPSAGSGITSILGDTGTITGSSVMIYSDNTANNCGCSVLFSNSTSVSLLNVTDSSGNTCVGQSAGTAALTAGGANCTALGLLTLAAASTNTNCIAIGRAALNADTSGSDQIAIGSFSLRNIDGGNSNIGIGFESLENLLTGSNNLCIGNSSGTSYTGAETNNLLIGSLGVTGESNTIRIIPQSGAATSTFISGIFGKTTSDVGSTTAVLIDNTGNLGTIASSARYKENIKDLGDKSSALYKLRPVSFNYKKDEKKTLQAGLIAEEVLLVMPDLVVMKDGVPETVKYHDLPVLLLNEIQKLRAEIDLLKKGK